MPFSTDAFPDWVNNIAQLSADKSLIAYSTTTDSFSGTQANGYFNPGGDQPLPAGCGVGTIIVVTAVDGRGVLVITQTSMPVKTSLEIDLYSTELTQPANASFPAFIFQGKKLTDDAPDDNKESFQVSQAFGVPAYIGPGTFFTTVQPSGRYFGEGLIQYKVDPDQGFTYPISLCSSPVNLSLNFVHLDWRYNIDPPPPEASADDWEQYLSLAVGPSAGADFRDATEKTVAVGYKALNKAQAQCSAVTAVGSKALSMCVAPTDTVAVGNGAMQASDLSDRNTCIGDGAGRWRAARIRWRPTTTIFRRMRAARMCSPAGPISGPPRDTISLGRS